MKNAKTMFEELGFFPSYNYKNDLIKEKEIVFYHYEFGNKMISFNLINKTLWIDPNYGEINLKELQAINQQIDELWGGMKEKK